jgi:aspartyl-tRNA(Asn)/glutamyl-tRNA(Gln) amidotransferase subunit B
MNEDLNFFDKSSRYEAVIGMEVHVQLNTSSKIFCGCVNAPSSIANGNICVVCCGYPGTLPVLNKMVLDKAIMVSLATNSKINKYNRFDRKHYFYADLPKGYQITQSDFPICSNGYVEIEKEDRNKKKIRIHHIHIEEDAGKNIHDDSFGSLVDLNRAGTPLLEIVSYPDMSSAFEVRAYLKELYSIISSLGVSSCNMEDGAFRGDANVSVRLVGVEALGTKCELKNINSFKFIHDAVEYEISRQIEELENGGAIKQQTRLWDSKNRKTFVMREKESADDYRYFPDPDIPPIIIDDLWVEDIRKMMPELPQQKRNRFIVDYSMSEYEANIFVYNSNLSDYFEEAYKLHKSKTLISFILRELLAIIKGHDDFKKINFTPSHISSLVKMLDEKKITQKIASDVFNECFFTGEMPEEYVNRNSLFLSEISDEEIRVIIEKIIRDNYAQFNEYVSGKDKLIGFFIGKIISATKGSVDPSRIQKIFREFKP